MQPQHLSIHGDRNLCKHQIVKFNQHQMVILISSNPTVNVSIKTWNSEPHGPSAVGCHSWMTSIRLCYTAESIWPLQTCFFLKGELLHSTTKVSKLNFDPTYKTTILTGVFRTSQRITGHCPWLSVMNHYHWLVTSHHWRVDDRSVSWFTVHIYLHD